MKRLRDRLTRLRLAVKTGITVWRIGKLMTDAQTKSVNKIVDGVQLAAEGLTELTATVKDEEILSKLKPLIDAAQTYLLRGQS